MPEKDLSASTDVVFAGSSEKLGDALTEADIPFCERSILWLKSRLGLAALTPATPCPSGSARPAHTPLNDLNKNKNNTKKTSLLFERATKYTYTLYYYYFLFYLFTHPGCNMVQSYMCFMAPRNLAEHAAYACRPFETQRTTRPFRPANKTHAHIVLRIPKYSQLCLAFMKPE